MESSAPPKEWRELDSWWTAFTESTSAVSTSEMTRRFDDGSLPSHWKVTDTWWDEYIEEYSLSEVADTSVSLDQRFFQEEWEELDSWWDEYIEEYSLSEIAGTSVNLDQRFIQEEWKVLDSWWESHFQSRQDDLANLQRVLEEVQAEWQQSGGRFRKGPLTTDWDSNKGVTEPLRTYQEENWSQWLAHLLHSAPPEFLTNLFGEDYDRQPNSVEREVYLPDREGTSRYADIVLFYEDRGLSIEVKKGRQALLQNYRHSFADRISLCQGLGTCTSPTEI